MELTETAVILLLVFTGLSLLIVCMIAISFFSLERKKALPANRAEAVTAVLPAQPAPSLAITPEVIAAITAAIAAVWQADTGFVVRRVRRIHTAPAWNRAGRDDQIYSRL